MSNLRIGLDEYRQYQRRYASILDHVAAEYVLDRDYLKTSGSPQYSKMRAAVFEGMVKCGLSHEEIAWIVGMTRQTVQLGTKRAFRSGRPTPEARHVREMAAHLWANPNEAMKPPSPARPVVMVPELKEPPKRMTGQDKLREWEEAKARRERIQKMVEQSRGDGYAPSPVAIGLY